MAAGRLLTAHCPSHCICMSIRLSVFSLNTPSRELAEAVLRAGGPALGQAQRDGPGVPPSPYQCQLAAMTLTHKGSDFDLMDAPEPQAWEVGVVMAPSARRRGWRLASAVMRFPGSHQPVSGPSGLNPGPSALGRVLSTQQSPGAGGRVADVPVGSGCPSGDRACGQGV